MVSSRSRAQQHLNGAQVGAGFEQVCGERVSQRVRVDVFLEAGSLGGLLASGPRPLLVVSVYDRDASGCRGTGRCLASAESAPVLTQHFQQPRAEHDIPVFSALAALAWITMRSLSMSLTFRCVNSARRTPVA